MKKQNKKVMNKDANELAASLGLSEADAVSWEVRFSLTKKVIELFEKKSTTITEIASLSGTSRGRVTKVLKNDTSGISLDVLFRILGALGHSVKITYKKAA